MAHIRQAFPGGQASQGWQAVRTGQWLTASRARGYGLVVLGLSVLAIAGWVALSHGLVDRNGKPLGTDFSSFYAAGSLVLDGRAADVYDMAAHYAREQQTFGPATPYYAWFYPPIFLLVATPLAAMPYPLALLVWQAASFALYLGVIGGIVRRMTRLAAAQQRLALLLAAGFPAVLVNLGHGQNGFLSAGLIGAALLALPTRPIVAGVLIGLLAYKPQLAIVIPIALLAAGQWRAILAAGVTVSALILISALWFGAELWPAFAASMDTSRTLLLEQGDVRYAKLQSVFAAVRLWGGGIPLAYAMQGLATAAVVCGVAWIWRSLVDHDLKAALLVVATLLASPHVIDYDLTMMAVAIAFFVRHGLAHGFRDYEISILGLAWIAPLLARSIAGITGLPLGLLVLLALFGLILRRAAREAANEKRHQTKLAQA
jgi:alpha-1,2-mannosyltransferase